LKKKNESLSSNFNSQIKELKESHEKELNQIKQNYENKINDMKKDFATKEDIKYFAKKHEIDYVKEELDDLNSKFNNLDREYNSKMGFMESNMERIFKIEEENKNQEGNKIVINQKEKNDNNINININNNEKNNNNNIINNNIINNNIIKYDYFDEKKKESIKKGLNDKFDTKIYKNLKKILDDIFLEKNLNKQEINTKSKDNLKKEAEKLFKNKDDPLEYFNGYINNVINEKQKKLSQEQMNNLVHKKIFVFQTMNDINAQLLPMLNKTGKEPKKVDLKDFDIQGLRKDFNLSEEQYPDEYLQKLYKAYKGDLDRIVLKLVIKE